MALLSDKGHALECHAGQGFRHKLSWQRGQTYGPVLRHVEGAHLLYQEMRQGVASPDTRDALQGQLLKPRIEGHFSFSRRCVRGSATLATQVIL